MPSVYRNPSLEELEGLLARSESLTLLYVFDTQCPSCKTMEPVFNQFAAEVQDMDIVYVDVQLIPSIWDAFGMTSVPSTFIVRAGDILAEGIGPLAVEQLRELLNGLST